MFRKDQAPAKTLDPGSTVSASAHSYYMTYPDGRQERLDPAVNTDLVTALWVATCNDL